MDGNRNPRSWQPRFGLGGLLLFMLVVSVMGAATYYGAQALRGRDEFQATFILFTLIAPLLLVVVLSTIHAILVRRRRQ
jgi:hypothetical protein